MISELRSDVVKLSVHGSLLINKSGFRNRSSYASIILFVSLNAALKNDKSCLLTCLWHVPVHVCDKLPSLEKIY